MLNQVQPGISYGCPALLNLIKEMKIITVHRLSLQFDADRTTHGNDREQAHQALHQINTVLRREPFGLGAQLIATPDEIEIESAEDQPE